MSDRIAVFNAGRIEQIGTPMDVYERPATEFVAGFVGTSNLIQGDAARSVLGSTGVVSVRPEKIRVAAVSDSPESGEDSAVGTVREVIYVGSGTRFVVDLDAGGRLVALQQNVTGTPDALIGMRGEKVRLVWSKEYEYRVGSSA